MFLFATARRETTGGLLSLVLVDCVRQCEFMCGKVFTVGDRENADKSVSPIIVFAFGYSPHRLVGSYRFGGGGYFPIGPAKS